MSDVQLDERGFIITCPSCAQRNRMAFSTREARCGRCKSPLPPPSEPIEVPDARAFDALVRDGRQPVVVDFWAPWCGPCRLVSPVVEAVGEAHADKIVTAKVNTDENQQLAMRYSIFSIPTMIVFKDGREAARLVGYMPQAALEERLRDFLA